jgi:hypothetical protein
MKLTRRQQTVIDDVGACSGRFAGLHVRAANAVSTVFADLQATIERLEDELQEATDQRDEARDERDLARVLAEKHRNALTPDGRCPSCQSTGEEMRALCELQDRRKRGQR